MISSTLALTLLTAMISTSPPPRVHDLPIVSQAIEFHGGKRYHASETELDLCSKSGCFHLVSRVEGGRFDHTVTGQAGDKKRKVRITNDTLELWADGVHTPVSPPDAQRMRDWAMARIYFPFLPYRLDDPDVWKQDQGLETWSGRQLHRVKVTFSAGSSSAADDEYAYWLDPESGRVEQFAYSYSGKPGGLRFRRATEHRRIGGILFFDQENYGVEGEGLSVDQITPEFAAEMRHVSTVELRDIEVRPLASDDVATP